MPSLNQRAKAEFDVLVQRADEWRLRVLPQEGDGTGCLVDCGVATPGSLAAGLQFARVCLAGLGDVSLAYGTLGDEPWPVLTVSTDHPALACLGSQYAGWQLSVEKFFAMGSGPMRALARREPLFAQLEITEQSDVAVGLLEGRKLPAEPVWRYLAERCALPASRVHLAIAPTASLVGNVQVVSRVVETALHKLFELGFDVRRIRSAIGTAPLPPVAVDDLTGIGRTNDAILYGGHVTLWVTGDDASLHEIGPRVPACSARGYGESFLQIFEQAGRDFYKIDPHLFSPARIIFQNVETGRTCSFGKLDPTLLRHSFGVQA